VQPASAPPLLLELPEPPPLLELPASAPLLLELPEPPPLAHPPLLLELPLPETPLLDPLPTWLCARCARRCARSHERLEHDCVTH
jgi:hypothetical protein